MARNLPDIETRRVFDLVTKRYWWHAWWWVPQALLRGGVDKVHAAIESKPPPAASSEPWAPVRRWHFMVMRTFLIYAVVEMAVIIALTATIGFGWTVIALLGAFVLGIALAGSQLRRQIEQLQRGMRDPRAQVTDSALVALGSVLVFVPGLVTTRRRSADAGAAHSFGCSSAGHRVGGAWSVASGGVRGARRLHRRRSHPHQYRQNRRNRADPDGYPDVYEAARTGR